MNGESEDERIIHGFLGILFSNKLFRPKFDGVNDFIFVSVASLRNRFERPEKYSNVQVVMLVHVLLTCFLSHRPSVLERD